MRCARRRHRGEHTGRSDQVGAHDAVVTGRGQPGAEAQHPTGRVAGETERHGIVAVDHEHPRCALVTEELGLRPGVGGDRSVPVEVVLGHVQEDGDVGGEGVGGERELERGDLGDHHLDVVAGGVEQRSPDVARGGAADPGLAQDGVDEGRDRGLPVGPRDRDEAWAVGAGAETGRRQIDLRAHRHPGVVRRDQRGVVGPDTRARHHEVGGASLLGGVGGGGSLEHARALGLGARAAASA